MNIYDISCKMKSIYEQLETGEGIDKETGEISPDIMNEIALTQQNLQQKAIDYGYVLKSFDDEIDIYDKEIKRLTERKKSIKNARDRLANNLLAAMIEFSIEKIEGKTIKISLRNSEAVEIVAPEQLPDEYKVAKVINEADKIAIKEAIKAGKTVKGAELITRKNLQIR